MAELIKKNKKQKLSELFFSPPVVPRLLQSCTDESLNVAVPMRMLEIFSSEKTYLPVIPDANYVASLLEQILHYMVQKGEFKWNLFKHTHANRTKPKLCPS